MIGTKLAHYEITSHLGTGGMGEVYQATDSKLGRSVAIKLLPQTFSSDADRAARFEREARVLASLNHPNIAAIHGIDESEGRKFLVMELVAGDTLADRIARGALAIDESLGIAIQIAEALEAAHEKGVIHRDLKPANVKVTPDGIVKLLDFGLAKAIMDDLPRQSTLSQSPTLLSMEATNAGVILGTAPYMSPEQAKGRSVDRRADIWAFGVVLYEMLSGRMMFSGDSVPETLAAIMMKETEWGALPANTPARLRELLRRCLVKDPRYRLQAIGDARIALQEIEEALNRGVPEDQTEQQTRPAEVRRSGRLLWVGITAITTLAALVMGFVAFRHTPEEPPRVVKLTMVGAENENSMSIGFPPAVSPDGRHIVFGMNVDGKQSLWIRDLDSSVPRALAGTENGSYPFWSPDSRNIAFGANGKLKKIDIAGGSAVTLCDAIQLNGGTWSKNDVIIFAPGAALYRVSAAGGMPAPVTELDKSKAESRHLFPWFLPDGHHFLFLGRRLPNQGTDAVYAADLDSKERKLLVSGDTPAWYTPPLRGSAGYLLFMRERTLMAQPFDAEKIALTGEAVTIAEDIAHVPAGAAGVSVSSMGELVLVTGVTTDYTQVTWFDRSGKELGTVGTPGRIEWASLSPDEKTVALDRADPNTGTYDLWLHDLVRGAASRLTFDKNARFPVWSPDGSRIAFVGEKGSTFTKRANGTGQEEPVADTPDRRPNDWSRDGRYIFAETAANKQIWVHPMSGDQKPFVILHGGFNENSVKLSPDGHWLAYQANESRRQEVYVVSFPSPEAKFQISINGGRIPIWSRDGRELYFIGADRKLMAVKVNTAGGKFQAGAPQPLFEVRPGALNPNFSVSRDGRFLIPINARVPKLQSLTVVLNWQAGLKK